LNSPESLFPPGYFLSLIGRRKSDEDIAPLSMGRLEKLHTMIIDLEGEMSNRCSKNPEFKKALESVHEIHEFVHGLLERAEGRRIPELPLKSANK
jgi:hypothetical protein